MEELEEIGKIELAYSLGFLVPSPRLVESLSPEEIDSMMGSWEFHGEILLKKVDGLPINFTAWWNGTEYIIRTACIKDKFSCDRGRGIQLPENLVTMFPTSSNPIGDKFNKIIPLLGEGYKGFVSMDVKISEEMIYYQDINIGVSHDILACYCKLYGFSIEDLFERIDEGLEFTPVKNYAASARIYSYPYNPDFNKEIIDDTSEFVEGDDCFIFASSDDKIKGVWNKIYSKINTLPDWVTFRTDGVLKARKVFAEIKRKSLF